MFNAEKLAQISQQIIHDLPSHLTPFKEEMATHLKSILQNIFAKLDLVTHEEFDTQIKVLLETQKKLEDLENQLKQLEDKEKPLA